MAPCHRLVVCFGGLKENMTCVFFIRAALSRCNFLRVYLLFSVCVVFGTRGVGGVGCGWILVGPSAHDERMPDNRLLKSLIFQLILPPLE